MPLWKFCFTEKIKEKKWIQLGLAYLQYNWTPTLLNKRSRITTVKLDKSFWAHQLEVWIKISIIWLKKRTYPRIWLWVTNLKKVITICCNWEVVDGETDKLCLWVGNFPLAILVWGIWLQTICGVYYDSCPHVSSRLFQNDWISTTAFCKREN